jgi:predicted GNAT superfamily acetyltransferase
VSLLEPIDGAALMEVLALNQACVPEVGALAVAALAELVRQAEVAVLTRDAQGLSSFVIALDPHTHYQSPNYRWFCARAQDFLYVDRIAVAARARGQGLGRTLYDEVLRRAVSLRAREVTCEVNTLPENPGSLAFHARLGFERVGELVHEPGKKAVAMLAREVRRG